MNLVPHCMDQGITGFTGNFTGSAPSVDHGQPTHSLFYFYSQIDVYTFFKDSLTSFTGRLLL